MMTKSIAHQSHGRYQAVLPQDLEVNPTRNSTIRDADLLALLSADIALFHFDGTELDSGTVVEFMVAKFADIPAVILRTDFRRAGDSHADAWNLMLSDYPRTRQVIVHALELYHGQRKSGRSANEASELATHDTAQRIISAFDEVRMLPPVLSPDLAEPVYQWLALFPCFNMESPVVWEALQEIRRVKVRKRLLL